MRQSAGEGFSRHGRGQKGARGYGMEQKKYGGLDSGLPVNLYWGAMRLPWSNWKAWVPGLLTWMRSSASIWIATMQTVCAL